MEAVTWKCIKAMCGRNFVCGVIIGAGAVILANRYFKQDRKTDR